jgi:putative peptidoglycan lipid II flippase
MDAPPAPDASAGRSRLLRSTGVVSGMTLLSRILGLVRDVVFARLFGAGLGMDAFFVANKIPNMLRRFFAEGAFAQAFVPVFTDYRSTRGEAQTRELADAVTGVLALVLFVVTLLGVLAAPALVFLVAPGFAQNGERFDLSVEMLRWTFPYLMFISLTALAGGILNAHGRFAVPAFTPVLLNVVLIAFALWLSPRFAQPEMALAIGVFAAGLVQLVFQFPALARIRLLPRPRLNLQHPGVRRVGALMLPAIFGSSVAQINVVFDNIIASFLQAGSVSWLYYADRLMEFPLGVFGIALATVILPNLSRQHAARSPAEFSRTLDWALRMVVLIAAPAAVGLCLLAGPMLTTLFYGGRFGIEDTGMARLSLVAYGLGLPGFMLVKVLVPGYFARQDTRTPVRYGVIALAANMVMNVVFVLAWLRLDRPGAHAALALATSLSAFINAGLLYQGLRRSAILEPAPGWGRFLLRVGVACGVMAMILVEASPAAAAWFEASLPTRVLWLSALVTAGAATYFATLFAAGLRPAMLRMKSPG